MYLVSHWSGIIVAVFARRTIVAIPAWPRTDRVHFTNQPFWARPHFQPFRLGRNFGSWPGDRRERPTSRACLVLLKARHKKQPSAGWNPAKSSTCAPSCILLIPGLRHQRRRRIRTSVDMNMYSSSHRPKTRNIFETESQAHGPATAPVAPRSPLTQQVSSNLWTRVHRSGCGGREGQRA